LKMLGNDDSKTAHILRIVICISATEIVTERIEDSILEDD